MKKVLSIMSLVILCLIVCLSNIAKPAVAIAENKDFIKWADFKCSYEIMKKAYKIDLESYQSNNHIKFVDMLSYVALKNGNKFNFKADEKNLDFFVSSIKNGNSIAELGGENKYYKYYHEVYSAAVGNFIGEYEKDGKTMYGIKVFHPIAKDYWYSHNDDFGNSRNFGFKRKHTGHDIWGSIGTPIIAVESGTITNLGWNRYGGWRIGIRSEDTKRYFYYAHLRKDKPYVSNLKIGDKVVAGQVIGYLGVTGYSYKENVNMSTKPHLHFGMQLIFDESQVKGNNEIWIDVYDICKFLSSNRIAVEKNQQTKDFQTIGEKSIIKVD